MTKHSHNSTVRRQNSYQDGGKLFLTAETALHNVCIDQSITNNYFEYLHLL